MPIPWLCGEPAGGGQRVGACAHRRSVSPARVAGVRRVSQLGDVSQHDVPELRHSGPQDWQVQVERVAETARIWAAD